MIEIQASTIDGLELTPPDETISLPVRFPQSALDFSVVVHSKAPLPIAFLGVRFELLRGEGPPAFSMSYADSLRHPAQAEMVPGSSRLVSVEHGVTEAVLRACPLDEMPGWQRIQMNLARLSGMARVIASIDCVAYANGHFFGPDEAGAFSRLAAEREAETRFQHAMLERADAPDGELLRVLAAGKVKRFARLADLWERSGREAVLDTLRRHAPRIPLQRR